MSEHPQEVLAPSYLETLQYQTPFFVFSKQRIIDSYTAFKKYFPNVLVHYAMKANSEPEVLEVLHDIGAGFEVASRYELELLQKIHVPAEKILYGTAVKPIDHIQSFFEYGVDRFAADSLSELVKIASVAPGSRVYIRASVSDRGSVFKFSEKFGTNKQTIIPLLVKAKELGLVPYGISYHVGSQASNMNAWAEALEELSEVIEEAKKMNMPLEILNIGGGYPCGEYASTENVFGLKEISQPFYEVYKKLSYRPDIVLESGRALIACAGVAVTTIIAKIERPEQTWLFLDLGVYNGLFEAMAYQGSTRYRVTSMRESTGSGEALFALAGPTGDSPDIITREVRLPKDIDVGDKLIIHDVGAYSLSVTSTFNGFPKPEAYFV